jgi:hypothetical protein
MVMLGLPVMTADYDYWLHIDDIERFNAALEGHDHFANATPDERANAGATSSRTASTST